MSTEPAGQYAYGRSSREDVAAAVSDLLPSAFDSLYVSLGGTNEPRRVRGIVARTLVEHLHLLIQRSIEPPGLPAPGNARGAREFWTFDRYSSREVPRDDLLTRMSSRLADDVVAQVAVALVELRTDLALARIGYLFIDGVGRIEPESQSSAPLCTANEAASLWLAESSWPEGRRARKWFLRSVADRLLLSVVVRSPCMYRMHVPAIVMQSPPAAAEAGKFGVDESTTYEALFGRRDG
jgi:hypothetical protein